MDEVDEPGEPDVGPEVVHAHADDISAVHERTCLRRAPIDDLAWGQPAEEALPAEGHGRAGCGDLGPRRPELTRDRAEEHGRCVSPCARHGIRIHRRARLDAALDATLGPLLVDQDGNALEDDGLDVRTGRAQHLEL